MRHSIPFLIFQLFGFLAFGQVAHWESYFQPARAQQHLEEETRLWLPTDVGLLEVNKETGEYTLWNKGHGGQWFAYSPDNAPLANEAIREVGLGRNGALWVTHQQGTSFIDKGQLSPASASGSRNKPVKQVGVFPNPAGETVFLDGVLGNGRGVVLLFNIQGQPVAAIPAVFSEGGPVELSLPELAPGWYAGRVHLNGNRYMFRLLKSN